MHNNFNSHSPHFALLCLCALLALFPACNRQKSQTAATVADSGTKRYPFKGKVVSIDKNSGTANIDNEPIVGFMDPMVMPYTFKPQAQIDQLQPGDTITADVVVEPEKYWLENVKVVSHSKAPAGVPTATLHIPSPGDEVPDFQLINQSGRRVSLHSYRGQTLLL